jgi:hypothetical protein
MAYNICTDCGAVTAPNKPPYLQTLCGKCLKRFHEERCVPCDRAGTPLVLPEGAAVCEKSAPSLLYR